MASQLAWKLSVDLCLDDRFAQQINTVSTLEENQEDLGWELSVDTSGSGRGIPGAGKPPFGGCFLLKEVGFYKWKHESWGITKVLGDLVGFKLSYCKECVICLEK